MEKLCEYKLDGCLEEAIHVAYLGAHGDAYACGNCVHLTDEPELFVELGKANCAP